MTELPAETTGACPAVRQVVTAHVAMPASRPGDPVKATERMIANVVGGSGGLRQILGSHSHAYATAKVSALSAPLDATGDSAPLTDFARS